MSVAQFVNVLFMVEEFLHVLNFDVNVLVSSVEAVVFCRCFYYVCAYYLRSGSNNLLYWPKALSVCGEDVINIFLYKFYWFFLVKARILDRENDRKNRTTLFIVCKLIIFNWNNYLLYFILWFLSGAVL